MNVKELKKLLNNFPDEMEIVVWDEDTFCDYKKITIAEIVTGILQKECIVNAEAASRDDENLFQSYLFIGY